MLELLRGSRMDPAILYEWLPRLEVDLQVRLSTSSEDLARYVPSLSTRLVTRKTKAPVHSLVQLAYVLPATSLDLLPEYLKHMLLLSHSEWYEPEGPMLTAFCKYIWEAHPRLPPIDLCT